MSVKDYTQLALTQFESLRLEILQKINEAGITLRFGIISSGAIWTWLATNSTTIKGLELIVWTPTLLVALLALMYGSIRLDIKNLSQKIASIEKEFNLPSSLCWESNWSDGISKTVSLSWVIWVVLLIGNSILAIFSV